MVHTPAQHDSPSPQVIPHPPQLELSEEVSVQVSPQRVLPAAQAIPPSPNCAWHSPLTQPSPDAQGELQSPQCSDEDWRSTHPPLQRVSPPGHLRPRIVFNQLERNPSEGLASLATLSAGATIFPFGTTAVGTVDTSPTSLVTIFSKQFSGLLVVGSYPQRILVPPQ